MGGEHQPLAPTLPSEGAVLLNASEIIPLHGADDVVQPLPVRFRRIDIVLRWITELPAAIILLGEIVLDFWGVVSRYVLNQPLDWADEVTEVGFIWMIMLGSVIALRRNEHMRMTALVNMASPSFRSFFTTMSSLIIILFVGVMIGPVFDYITLQAQVSTATLGIPDGIRIAAIPYGFVLFLLTALLQLSARADIKHVLIGIVIGILIIGALFLAKPLLAAMGNYNLFIFFIVLFLSAIAMGLPIAFCFGISTVAYLSFASASPYLIFVNRMEEGMSSLLLLAVPLFVFLGYILQISGFARALVDFVASLVGHLRGGLYYVLLAAMYLVSGISGSKAADMAAVAPALFPEMKKRGSEPGELIAVLASSSAMSETIPPSIVLIVVGAALAVPIGSLFAAGLVPALVCALALVIVVRFRGRKDDLSHIKRAPVRQVLKSFAIAIPALILPFLVRSAVIEGVATPTEVSTIAAVYTLIVGPLMYRGFEWRLIYPLMVDTVALSGAILLIIGMATTMGWALTYSGFSNQVTEVIRLVIHSKLEFMALSIVLFAVLGSLLEGIPVIILFGPLLFPIAQSLGINEIHYAIVVVIAMGIGLHAPPLGIGFYTACAIGRVPPEQAMPRMWPYIAALILALVLIAAVPWLTIAFI
jgi:tripartite ATP-independent transporter DctM subunit